MRETGKHRSEKQRTEREGETRRMRERRAACVTMLCCWGDAAAACWVLSAAKLATDLTTPAGGLFEL